MAVEPHPEFSDLAIRALSAVRLMGADNPNPRAVFSAACGSILLPTMRCAFSGG